MLGTKKQCVHMYMNLDLSHGNCPYLYKVWDAQAACIHGHNFYNKYNVMYVCICSCCINSMMSNVITSYRFVTYSDVIAMTRREDVPVAWDQWVRAEVLRPQRLIRCLPFEEWWDIGCILLNLESRLRRLDMNVVLSDAWTKHLRVWEEYALQGRRRKLLW